MKCRLRCHRFRVCLHKSACQVRTCFHGRSITLTSLSFHDRTAPRMSSGNHKYCQDRKIERKFHCIANFDSWLGQQQSPRLGFRQILAPLHCIWCIWTTRRQTSKLLQLSLHQTVHPDYPVLPGFQTCLLWRSRTWFPIILEVSTGRTLKGLPGMLNDCCFCFCLHPAAVNFKTRTQYLACCLPLLK